MSLELQLKKEEFNEAFEDFRIMCGADECRPKEIVQEKKRVNYFVIFLAIAFLLTSCSSTYSFPVINNEVIKRHEQAK